MKIFFLISFFILTVFFGLAGSVKANYVLDVDRQFNAYAGAQGANLGVAQDPRIVVARLILAALTLVGTLFLAYSVYAGYMILGSAGNEERITKGKSTLRTGVIGILVALSAYSIVYFVSTALWGATQTRDGIDFGITTNARDTRTPNNDPYASDGSSFIPDAWNEP